MFSQSTPRISHFSRALHKLDVSQGSAAGPPVPLTNDANGFGSVHLLNAEPTPGSSSDVDAFDANVSDTQFPQSYLPTDEAIPEPRDVLNMLDADTSGDISGLFSLPHNFGIPAVPNNWDPTTFNRNSIADESNSFETTESKPGDDPVASRQIVSQDGSIVQLHPGTHLDDLAYSSELLMDISQLMPGHLQSCPSSVFTTPGSVTPISSVSQLSLSPTEEQPPSSALRDPRPCLAVPTSSEVYRTTIQVPMSPVKEKGNSPVLPIFDSIKADPSTSNHIPSGARSPSPALPDQFFIQKRSSTGAQRSSRAKVKPTVSRPTKVRRSRRGKSKDLPCTHEGCLETFSDTPVLKRHLQTVHQVTRWYCPGSCRRSYTRDDALNRHLNTVGDGSACQSAARALGWHPNEKCSIRRLRADPPPPD